MAIRVAVAGAAGRMGETVCRAVQGADDMELVARADPALNLALPDALAARPDVLVDFTVPSTALVNVREAVAAGVHAVVGTTGFDAGELAAPTCSSPPTSRSGPY
jgi:4-hydroxy-tetrahydrodipicolinate reductase